MLEIKQESDVTLLTVQARRMDAAMAPQFRKDVLELVNGGAHRVVLDLSQVEFMDSSGLGALVSILKAIGNRGRLAVCNVQATVQQLFKLTRMDKVFSILPDAVEAAAAVRS